MLTSPGDGHDYETQDDWDESPPNEYYPGYPPGDKEGSSEDDEEEDDEPHYEAVSINYNY